MREENLSANEDFQTDFYYFIESLITLALDPLMQYERMGSRNIASELQHDVLEFGGAVATRKGAFFILSEREEIALLLKDTQSLPPEALSGAEALQHPRWSYLRVQAALLLMRLAPLVKRSSKKSLCLSE